MKLGLQIALTNCSRCGDVLCTREVPGAEDLAGVCGDCLSPREKRRLLEAMGPEAVSRALIVEMAGMREE
jgi:hypothetical protein